MKKVGIVSLGCSKNLVDSEILLAVFHNAGYEISNSPKECDIILVNTCGFINSAKEEAIETILEMAKFKKSKLIVTGCLPERYLKELKKSLPEVDLFIPFSSYKDLANILKEYLKDNKHDYSFNPLNRVLSTPGYTAYLRISEGCNNFCSFCAIPYIRGRLKSRPINEIIAEVKSLVSSGVIELNIISQDTSSYGLDFKDGTTIVTLLKELLKFKEIKSIRLLYLYPSEITDEFISLFKGNIVLEPYFDIPLQHASNPILKRMNRKGSQEKTLETLNKIKKEVNNAVLRTTFIVGFPGETTKDFNALLDFVKDMQFDHMGAFTYSREEGTTSYKYEDQISERVKKHRLDLLMNEQKKISYKKNSSHIGETLRGLCIGVNSDTNTYYFRTRYNAPDDIDGGVFAKCDKPLKVGEYYSLKIINAFVYDLQVEVCD